MISNNNKGNPNHDENGRFTSKNGGRGDGQSRANLLQKKRRAERKARAIARAKEIYNSPEFKEEAEQLNKKILDSNPNLQFIQNQNKYHDDLKKSGLSSRTMNLIVRSGKYENIDDFIKDATENPNFKLNGAKSTREAKYFANFYRKNGKFPTENEIDYDYINGDSYSARIQSTLGINENDIEEDAQAFSNDNSYEDKIQKQLGIRGTQTPDQLSDGPSEELSPEENDKLNNDYKNKWYNKEPVQKDEPNPKNKYKLKETLGIKEEENYDRVPMEWDNWDSEQKSEWLKKREDWYNEKAREQKEAFNAKEEPKIEEPKETPKQEPEYEAGKLPDGTFQDDKGNKYTVDQLNEMIDKNIQEQIDFLRKAGVSEEWSKPNWDWLEDLLYGMPSGLRTDKEVQEMVRKKLEPYGPHPSSAKYRDWIANNGGK